jgi:hypothetical protein
VHIKLEKVKDRQDREIRVTMGDQDRKDNRAECSREHQNRAVIKMHKEQTDKELTDKEQTGKDLPIREEHVKAIRVVKDPIQDKEPVTKVTVQIPPDRVIKDRIMVSHVRQEQNRVRVIKDLHLKEITDRIIKEIRIHLIKTEPVDIRVVKEPADTKMVKERVGTKTVKEPVVIKTDRDQRELDIRVARDQPELDIRVARDQPVADIRVVRDQPVADIKADRDQRELDIRVARDQPVADIRAVRDQPVLAIRAARDQQEAATHRAARDQQEAVTHRVVRDRRVRVIFQDPPAKPDNVRVVVTAPEVTKVLIRMMTISRATTEPARELKKDPEVKKAANARTLINRY